MAKVNGTALFVGGPRDGEMTPLLDSDGETCCVVRAPICEDGWFKTTPEKLATPHSLEFYTYRRMDFWSPGGPPITVWAEPELTAHDVMVHLVVGYSMNVKKDGKCRSTLCNA